MYVRAVTVDLLVRPVHFVVQECTPSGIVNRVPVKVPYFFSLVIIKFALGISNTDLAFLNH